MFLWHFNFEYLHPCIKGIFMQTDGLEMYGCNGSKHISSLIAITYLNPCHIFSRGTVLSYGKTFLQKSFVTCLRHP
jgi:hypothetical protein